MRKLAAIVLVSLLPWFGVPVVEAAGSVSRVPLLHGVATSQGDVTRVSHNGVEIETLTGKAAIAHLRALQSKRARAFEKAAAVMRQRGFKPTDVVVVQRTIAKAIVPALTCAVALTLDAVWG